MNKIVSTTTTNVYLLAGSAILTASFLIGAIIFPASAGADTLSDTASTSSTSSISTSTISTSTPSISTDTGTIGIPTNILTSADSTSTDASTTDASVSASSTDNIIDSGTTTIDSTDDSSTTADISTSTMISASSTPSAIPASPTLTVHSIDEVQNVATADGLFMDGWQWVFNITVPENQTSFQMEFDDWKSSDVSATIPAADDVLISSPQSSSTPVVLAASNTYSDPIILNGNLDTNPSDDERQVQIMVDVLIPVGSTPDGSYSTSYGIQTSALATASTSAATSTDDIDTYLNI